MPNPAPTPISVADLALALGGTLIGDGARAISSCATLDTARPDQISFLHNSRYFKQLETTHAGCVILAPNTAKTIKRPPDAGPLTAIEIKDPYFAWQQTLVRLHGHRIHPAVGISPLASIHPSAKIGANANIHPYVVIGENVAIGDNVNLYPHVTLLHHASLGNDCTLFPSVTIYEHCRIGNRCILHAGTVVGSDGYGYATHNGVHHKIPQIGIVILEDDVEIGANSMIERAVLDATTIGTGSKLGNGVVIGHNSSVGPGNLLVSQVGLAGSTSTGKYVAMGGQAGVSGHMHIPDFVRISAQAGVMFPPEPGQEVGGTPAMEASLARRVYIQLAQLPDLAKRLKDLEKQLKREQPQSEQSP
ncbi:MAG TPA: UDP-3-O-(3-hydroxymyristoyl)glucosamine N-acyltransferase [Phycisphaerae bacterium]|nr:UDP-3-O-(3-hydroxymyristoyl)glucosamine N-acyltransferase [Phycisphaerae bacterium]